MQPWILDELKTVDLPDRRLNDRLTLVLDRLSAKPSASFPQAFHGRSELEAAYLFFSNPRNNSDTILAPHRDATLQRIRQHPVVLAAQDTTEIDLTRPEEVVGGPLSNDHRRGLFAHPLVVFTPEGLPLGTVALDLWARDPKSSRRKGRKRKHRPLEDKESRRWPQGYQQACRVATSAPSTEVICLSDSEGDTYEALQAAQPQAGQKMARFVIRACQNRSLARPEVEQAETAPSGSDTTVSPTRLVEAVAAGPQLATLQLEVSRRVALPSEKRKRKKAREAREATVSVRAARVKLRGPQRPGMGLPGGRLPDLEVNAVLVQEEQPPAGQEAVQWLLLTDLPIAEVEQVLRVVQYYCVRWKMEMLFGVLKGGCKIEERQLETQEAYEACVAVYLIVAWRILYMTMLGRRDPELPCEVVFDEEEWRGAYTLLEGRAPAEMPRLGEMIEVVARLGGYIKRGGESGGPPGPKVMWRGMQRLVDIVACWRAFGPDGLSEAGRHKLTG